MAAIGLVLGLSAVGLPAADALNASTAGGRVGQIRTVEPSPKKPKTEKKRCDGPLSKVTCAVKKAIPLVSPGGVLLAKGASKLQEKAGTTLKQFTPAGVVDEWAKSAAVGSTELLAKVQKKLLDTTKPKLNAKWWSVRYAVTYGLGLVLMAFTLVISIGQMSKGGPEQALVARETMARAPLYVPVVVSIPLVVMTLVDGLNGLAHWFGNETAPEAGSAIKTYVDSMSKMSDPTTLPGGALTLLVFGGVIFLAAVVALFELAFAQFGVYILTLLFPIVAAIAVNPKWRQSAYKLIGVLVGALLAPTALFFGFWVLWGGFAASVSEKSSSDRLGLLTFVGVGTIACVLAPIIIGMVLGSVASGAGIDHHASHSRAVRRGGMSAGRGISSATTRTVRLMGARGGGGGGRGGPRSGGSGKNRPSNGMNRANSPGSQRPGQTRAGRTGNQPSPGGNKKGSSSISSQRGSNDGGVGKDKKS